PAGETSRTRHMSRTGNSLRWRVITAYLNATPSRSTPPLFLQRLAPDAARHSRAGAGAPLGRPIPQRRRSPLRARVPHGVPTPGAGLGARPVRDPPAPAWLLARDARPPIARLPP